MGNQEVISPDKKLAFAQKDFELCFEQLKFYDDREISALKYLFGIASGAASLVFTLYGIVETPTIGFFGFLSFLALVIFLTTLILYCSALHNRVYFVLTASHINAIRKHFTEGLIPEDNYYYERRKALNWTSVHLCIIIGAALLSSLFLGLFVYYFNAAMGKPSSFIASLVTVIAVSLAEIGGGIFYLNYQDRKKKSLIKQDPNKAILE